MRDLATNNTRDTENTWPMVRLGDVCEFRRGLTYKKSDEVEYSSNIVLRSNNVSLESGTLDLSELKYIRESIEIPIEKKVVKDSILMCMANGSKSHLGKVALIEEDFGYAFGGFMGLLVPQGIEPGYLHFALKSGHFKRLIERLQDGANINNLKFADIEDYSFPLPPLSVQREIVARLEKELGEADRLAAKFKRVAELADDAFKAELDETFKTVEGEKVRLGDVCETITDGDHQPPPKVESGIPFLVISNVANGFLSFEDTRHVPNDYYRRIPDFKKPRRGDVLLTVTGSFGIPILVDSEREFCFQRHIALLRSRCLEPRFLVYCLSSHTSFIYFDKVATGTAQRTVSLSSIRNMEIEIPLLTTQRAIVTKLDAAKNRCEKLKAAALRGLAAAENMRKAILSEAFGQTERKGNEKD